MNREKVIDAFKERISSCSMIGDGFDVTLNWKLADDILALLKEQEEIINELLGLGYPHNFQHEAPWVVDYLYSLTEIIKKAFKAKEGR
jgi:hypothetical protein